MSNYLYLPLSYLTKTHTDMSGIHSFEKLLNQWLGRVQPKRVIEWGPGKSTEVILAYGADVSLVSIEHDVKWLNYWRQRIPLRVQFRHFDVSCRSSNYATNVLADHPYDLAFVDGRRRVECALAALANMGDEGVVLIHDWSRTNYSHILKIYTEVIDVADDTAVLRSKSCFRGSLSL